ncbi:Coiled-coil domain-containing protein 82 [Bagarius yarrelli]|uniref:Coiled-coil domain-containing protein 82 n=1 Tax=Bagarius yarrelli TaxID=175774 RepID=A0A556TXE6_BAGYA|nr:Coiled-coil domain-containing protein 82 [Bagarius yarrelli]
MKIFGFRRKRAPLVSRIDRKKTRLNAIEQMLEDSDEGSYCSTTSSDDSTSEYQESDDSDDSSASEREEAGDDSDGTEEEICAVSRRRRKRSASASVLDDIKDSSDSSDSDVGTDPVRKASSKKRLKLSDSEGENGKGKEEKEVEAKEAAAKRNERKKKLLELSKKRRTGTPVRRRRTLVYLHIVNNYNDNNNNNNNDCYIQESEKEDVTNNEPEDKKDVKSSDSESSEEETVRLIDSSEEEKQADTDSLKDFIVEDEEQKEGEEAEKEDEADDKNFRSYLPREFITGSQFTHFQLVVKALLINALDTSFLKSLYDGERTKRYAEELKSSLRHFDERLVLPRLENLKQRSRWKDRYKERVECYPKVRISVVNILTKGCEACELHRNGRYCVRLSGQLYHNQTLQEDQFMPDDSQMFFVGSVCASRTEVYHALKHFKYHLFERCRTALEDRKETEKQQTQEGEEDEPVKDTVVKMFNKLLEEGWIAQQYDEFQEHLNAADFFQEEKLD